MYKDKPWTLEKNSTRIVNKRTKKRTKERTNALILVEEFLKKNKSKMFTTLEIAKNIYRQKAGTSVAISQLRESNKIKVVRVDEASNNTLIAKYQYKGGPNKALPIIELGCEKGEGLITPKVFMKEYGVVNTTKFKYNIDKSNFTKYLIKARSNFCYAYKEEDLKRLLKIHGKTKKFKIQFKIFKWTITIE